MPLNNPAERALRSVAIGRKNYLFGGSERGAERAASFYTLIERAKLNWLDPEAYPSNYPHRCSAPTAMSCRRVPRFGPPAVDGPGEADFARMRTAVDELGRVLEDEDRPFSRRATDGSRGKMPS